MSAPVLHVLGRVRGGVGFSAFRRHHQLSVCGGVAYRYVEKDGRNSVRDLLNSPREVLRAFVSLCLSIYVCIYVHVHTYISVCIYVSMYV